MVFLGTGLGTVNAMPLPRLFGGIRKWWGDRLSYTTIFKRGLDIIRIIIGQLKGESKWGSSGSLDSNDLDIERL